MMLDGWTTYAPRIHAILIHGSVRPGLAHARYIKLQRAERVCGTPESDNHADWWLPETGCPWCKAVV